ADLDLDEIGHGIRVLFEKETYAARSTGRCKDSPQSSWPDLFRPSTCFRARDEDVDARHKAGHDVAWGGFKLTRCKPSLAHTLCYNGAHSLDEGRGGESGIGVRSGRVHREPSGEPAEARGLL